jgi:DNA-binding CsgD family transcriptional regulator
VTEVVLSAVPAPERPLFVILDDYGHPRGYSPHAREWLAHVGEPLVERMIRPARVDEHLLYVRSEEGGWITVRALTLHGAEQALVTIARSEPDEAIDALALACGLTPREHEVTTLVSRGLSTKQLAAELFISPWTVQDHLKSIFEKVGIRSRRELTGLLLGSVEAVARAA